MDWTIFYVVMAIAAAGITLMVTAFALVAVYGGWERAMRPAATGRWPLPRRLLLAGAALCWIFALLMFVPGVVPFWDLSSPATPWMMGVFFGFSVTMLYHRITQALRRRDGDSVAPADGSRQPGP